MDSQKEYWNHIFKEIPSNRPKYDLWLDKYQQLLLESKNLPIIDLGCGFGNNTFYLTERGYKVLSCDISEEALIRLTGLIDDLDTRCFDLQDGLPFESESAKIIVSDLSLHYFSWDITKKILHDINRVLMKDGSLLCRVNSTKDINYGAGIGIELEENFFELNGHFKRFFNEQQLRLLFKDWDIKYISEIKMNRYKNEKIAWEIYVKKI